MACTSTTPKAHWRELTTKGRKPDLSIMHATHLLIQIYNQLLSQISKDRRVMERSRMRLRMDARLLHRSRDLLTNSRPRIRLSYWNRGTENLVICKGVLRPGGCDHAQNTLRVSMGKYVYSQSFNFSIFIVPAVWWEIVWFTESDVSPFNFYHCILKTPFASWKQIEMTWHEYAKSVGAVWLEPGSRIFYVWTSEPLTGVYGREGEWLPFQGRQIYHSFSCHGWQLLSVGSMYRKINRNLQKSPPSEKW